MKAPFAYQTIGQGRAWTSVSARANGAIACKMLGFVTVKETWSFGNQDDPYQPIG